MPPNPTTTVITAGQNEAPEQIQSCTAKTTTSRADRIRAAIEEYMAKPMKDRLKQVNEDAIVRCDVELVDLIASGFKNHDFREFKLAESVKRVWLLEPELESGVTHVVEVGRAKRPGQVCDSAGIGNDDFNKRMMPERYAYPIVGVLRIDPPIRAKTLLEEYDVELGAGWMFLTSGMTVDYPISGMTRIM